MYSIGLMSGTSMDGIDAALLDTDGENLIKPLARASLTYEPSFKILLKAAKFALDQCHGDLAAAEKSFTSLLKTYLQNNFVNDRQLFSFSLSNIIAQSTYLHGQVIKKLLADYAIDITKINIIGYHGQTLYHQPAEKISLAVGDGAALANEFGIPVVNNFRAQDIAAGGQGAPFAPLYHQALAIRDHLIPLALVNCGGIANVSFITGETANDVCGFDIGPGNTLIDRYVQQRTASREFMDENGQYGKNGIPNAAILQQLAATAVMQNQENFLTKNPPKALDTNDLQLTTEVSKALNKLSLEDACATLETFTAQTIANSIDFIATKPKRWILVGGGWKNPVVLEKLKLFLTEKIGSDVNIQSADDIGWDSQATEAQIFAYLAVRSWKKLPLSLPTTTGVAKPLTGGTIHMPNRAHEFTHFEKGGR